PLERFVCLLDREDQERAFVTAHRRCRPMPIADQPAPPAPPIICLLPSIGDHYRHAPEDMADRLAVRTLPRILGWPEAATGTRWLDWPAPHLNRDEAFAELKSSLWNAMG